MMWFYIALCTPILHSISNHVDKYLVSKYVNRSGVETLMIYTSATSALVALACLLFQGTAISSLPVSHAWILIAAGILNSAAIFFYLYALEISEASVVVAFFHFVPLLTYLLGYFFLGEKIGPLELFACFLIILGGAILTIEFDEESGFKLRNATLILMSFCSLFFAAEGILFKYAALNENFWISAFWQYAGSALVGLCLFLFFSKARKNFIESAQMGGRKIFMLVLATDGLGVAGNLCLAFSSLLVPVVLARTVESYQPFFAICIGVIITSFFPNIAEEKITAKHLVQKAVAVAIMFAGSFLILRLG